LSFHYQRIIIDKTNHTKADILIILNNVLSFRSRFHSATNRISIYIHAHTIDEVKAIMNTFHSVFNVFIGLNKW